MRVIIGGVFSGIIRDAMIAAGHDAWSCDLLPSERKGPHYQCDVRTIMNQNWDLGIFHPDCTHLAVSGARWFPQKRADGRQHEAIAFFMEMVNAPIDMIAVEQPISIMSTLYRKPDQIIQPWMFGHGETKATCLWLKISRYLCRQTLFPAEKTGYTGCRQARTAGANEAAHIPASHRRWQNSGANHDPRIFYRCPLAAQRRAA